jgi:hypothetical protein
MSSLQPNSDSTPDVDKNALWGWWRSNAAWREKLDRKMAHKALDIPEGDPVNIKQGIGWKELAVIGAMILGSGGLMAYLIKPTAPVQPPVAMQPTDPADSEYEVRFYDADGNPIAVPRLPEDKR